MQTRVDAEIVVLFKARYRTAGKRVVKYKVN